MFISKGVVVPFLLNVTQSVHIKCRNIVAYEKQAVVDFFPLAGVKRDQPALFNPSERSEDAVSFVKLCPVPTTLGDKLLEAMTALSGDDQDIPKHSKDSLYG